MPFTAPQVRPCIFQARIVTRPDGLFDLSQNRSAPGEWADCATIDDDRGEHWDCVAWLHDRPQAWWHSAANQKRRGDSAPIMGAAEIIFAADMGCDVLLVETPESYVRRAWCDWPGPTACVLDWKRSDAIRLWLSLIKAVQCESDGLLSKVEFLFRGVPRWRRYPSRQNTICKRKIAA